MNPLKLQWSRVRAHMRLYHSWIMVHLDLHWKTRTRVRRRLVKAADWLEATLGVLDAQRKNSNNLQNDVNSINAAYDELLNQVAAIRAKEHPVREDIEIIKGKFLALLDLCGIKDADIPLFDEPHRVRSTRQTLITSFGIMSKSLNAAVTPIRTRGRPANSTGNYADMLIEHLLANVSPDSETSPPSTEGRSSGSSSLGSRLSPGSHTSSHHRQRNSATMHQHTPSRHLSQHTHLSLSHLLAPSPSVSISSNVQASNRDHRPQICASSELRDPTSECTNTFSPSHDGITDGTLVNATSGSTPELPVSESSESLDIPFASLFDNEEYFERIRGFPNEVRGPENTLTDNKSSSYIPQSPFYRFPVRYSHSYARELERVESVGNAVLNAESSPGRRPMPCFTDHSKPGSVKPESDHSIPCDTPLVVHLPDTQLSSCQNCSNKDDPVFDPKVDININNNYKPHLEDKSGLVSSDPESPKPPIPPRRPLTDSRVGRLVLQSDQSALGTLWSSQRANALPPDFQSHERLPEKARQDACMTTGKAYLREKTRYSHDVKLPRRDQLVIHQSTVHGSDSLSASKRRKGNDRSALPVDNDVIHLPRPVRQRLFASPQGTPTKSQSPTMSNVPTTSPKSVDSLHSPRSERTRKKRQSPAMRRLIQQKESNFLSPTVPKDSPRRPLSEIYNICLNESDPLTTSSNSLTPSSDTYAKSSETSPDLPLPSREDELRDRDAHYCDFTVDRQHKIDTLSPKDRLYLYRKDTKENCYTLEDPSTKEVLVRQVEGAEGSPNRNVFQVPKSTTRVPRAIQTQQARSASNPVRSASRPSSDSRRSSSSSSSKSDHRRRRRSSRSTSRGIPNSHPMASSTIIEHNSPDTDDGASSVPSIYTWTIEEGPETCNLEKSYIRSRQARKAQKAKSKPTTPRPPTSVGRDSPVDNKHPGFEITAMVTEINKHLNDTACSSQLVHGSPSKRNENASCRHRFLAGAPSLVGKAMCKNSVSNYSYDSCVSSQQASSSSMVFNRARASIQCSSNEPSDIPDLRQISAVPSSNRTLSSSAPELPGIIHSNDSSANDATPELLSELSILEEREDIPGKSSSSGSSSCTAARCRPRATKAKEPSIDIESVTAVSQNTDEQPAGNQDLIDSILTDSPKSVDSSGIFAPYNSYNSPAESVGSHNGYSSTVSSSVASSDNYLQPPKQPAVPPPTPSRAQSAEVFASEDAGMGESGGCKFKRPFNPAPHVSHTLKVPSTRSQGVSAVACYATPHRPLSVRSDPLATKSVFAIPPGVVTGPPKISDKKSLVKKLKKFSTNFYKKNEKIHTLANL